MKLPVAQNAKSNGQALRSHWVLGAATTVRRTPLSELSRAHVLPSIVANLIGTTGTGAIRL